MKFPIGRQYFYQEINQPEENINLAKAALYIAQEEYPNLDPQEYLNALDTMADEVNARLPLENYPLKIIQRINQYLYNDLGFYGNSKNYYDPCNSYLNEVLERRTGIPITLSLVYLEIAKRIEFPMVGIGMPGHFILRPDFNDVEIFVDAFHRGEILFEQDCQTKLSQLYQQPVTLKPEYLRPISNRTFLARMLTNLKYIYLNRQQFSSTLATVERILMLFPNASGELRDRGLLCYELGEYSRAIQDLEIYLEQYPQAEDAPAIRRLLEKMR